MEAFERAEKITKRCDVLVAKMDLYEHELTVQRMKPRELLNAVEDLSQSALSTDTWEKNRDVVKSTYSLLRECHAQLPHVRELLREGKLIEKAYEQLLELASSCLQKGEACLYQKHPLYFKEVLDHLGGASENHIFQFLESLSKEDFKKQYEAYEETIEFYNFMFLHQPLAYNQKRLYYRNGGYQSHVCGYHFSAISFS